MAPHQHRNPIGLQVCGALGHLGEIPVAVVYEHPTPPHVSVHPLFGGETQELFVLQQVFGLKIEVFPGEAPIGHEQRGGVAGAGGPVEAAHVCIEGRLGQGVLNARVAIEEHGQVAHQVPPSLRVDVQSLVPCCLEQPLALAPGRLLVALDAGGALGFLSCDMKLGILQGVHPGAVLGLRTVDHAPCRGDPGPLLQAGLDALGCRKNRVVKR